MQRDQKIRVGLACPFFRPDQRQHYPPLLQTPAILFEAIPSGYSGAAEQGPGEDTPDISDGNILAYPAGGAGAEILKR